MLHLGIGGSPWPWTGLQVWQHHFRWLSTNCGLQASVQSSLRGLRLPQKACFAKGWQSRWTRSGHMCFLTDPITLSPWASGRHLMPTSCPWPLVYQGVFYTSSSLHQKQVLIFWPSTRICWPSTRICWPLTRIRWPLTKIRWPLTKICWTLTRSQAFNLLSLLWNKQEGGIKFILITTWKWFILDKWCVFEQKKITEQLLRWRFFFP